MRYFVYPHNLPVPLIDYSFQSKGGILTHEMQPLRRFAGEIWFLLECRLILRSERQLRDWQVFLKRVGHNFWGAKWLRKAKFPTFVARLSSAPQITPMGQGKWQIGVSFELHAAPVFGFLPVNGIVANWGLGRFLS